jgi:hypothetical protein
VISILKTTKLLYEYEIDSARHEIDEMYLPYIYAFPRRTPQFNPLGIGVSGKFNS